MFELQWHLFQLRNGMLVPVAGWGSHGVEDVLRVNPTTREQPGEGEKNLVEVDGHRQVVEAQGRIVRHIEYAPDAIVVEVEAMELQLDKDERELCSARLPCPFRQQPKPFLVVLTEAALTCLPCCVGHGVEHRFKRIDFTVDGLTEHRVCKYADLLFPIGICHVWVKERCEEPVRVLATYPYPLRLFHERKTIEHVLSPFKILAVRCVRLTP